jgi:hypothetical protein
MKYLLAIFLMITLNANAFAASGICVMAHEGISIKEQPTPCHETKQEQSNTKLHSCECDMSSQFIYAVVLNIFNIPVISHTYISTAEHQSLTVSPKYRPPIYFLG